MICPSRLTKLLITNEVDERTITTVVTVAIAVHALPQWNAFIERLTLELSLIIACFRRNS